MKTPADEFFRRRQEAWKQKMEQHPDIVREDFTCMRCGVTLPDVETFAVYFKEAHNPDCKVDLCIPCVRNLYEKFPRVSPRAVYLTMLSDHAKKAWHERPLHIPADQLDDTEQL